jgi:hypothetical protein
MIYGPLKVKHDNIVSNYALSEQNYRLVIPFAENNFGPFTHIVFVIALFESPSKTLYRVLLASLYIQICIFYHQYIYSISCPTARSELIPTGNTTKNRQNNATFVSYDPAKARNGSQGQIAPTRVSLTSSRPQELLIGQLLRNVRECE